MKLKAIYETLDQVPEQYRDLYSGESGIGFRLSGVEGILFEEDHKGLKTALTQEREKTSALEGKIKKFGAVDPSKYNEWEKRVPELEVALEAANKDRATAINAAVEERIAPVLREKDSAISTLQANLEKVTGDFTKTVEVLRDRDFREKFRTEAPKYFVQDHAIEDVIFRSQSFGWQLDENGGLVALNRNGDSQYSRRNPTQVIDFKEWMSEVLPVDAPHLFKQSTGGGAAGSGKGGVRNRPWSELDTAGKADAVADAVARGENIHEFIGKQVLNTKK